MYRVIVNDEELELSNSKIQLSRVVFDLEDLSKRGITITNTLVVPATGKNNRLLGNPSRLSSNNRAFETRQRYELIDNDTIISRGDVIIKSYDDKKGISIQLAEGFDFFTNAGKKLLNDLDVHSDDFVFNTANMNTLKSKGESIFITALHTATGFGADAANGSQGYLYTRPSYNVRNILEKIVQELGYKVDYKNVLHLTKLNDLAFLSNTEKFLVSDYKRRYEGIAVTDVISLTAGTSVFTKSGNVSVTGDDLTNADFKTSYVVKGRIFSPNQNRLNIHINGRVERVTLNKGENFVNFRTDDVEIGSTVSFSVDGPATLTDVYIYSTINESEIIEVNQSFDLTGFLVLADYNLPKQTYLQFIKNLFVMLFINFDIDEYKKVITFNYLPKQINSNNTIDLSKSVQRYFKVSSGKVYGKLNVLSYQNDTNIDKDLGSAFVSFDNENAASAKDLLQISSYSASNEVLAGSENVITCDIYNKVEFKRNAVKDRIFALVETGAFGFNAVFSPVSFQQIYSENYFTFAEATKRERILEVEAFLTNLQFRNITKNPVIYIDFLQGTFLVSEISGFDRTGLCKMTIIKYN